jgi:aspartyl-tRNA(Asn)/glutamyl-tRNA(Gln) amidotransferase subunit A
MTNPVDLTLAQARDALQAGKISALELTKAHLAAMEKASALNCYVATTKGVYRLFGITDDDESFHLL